MSDTIPLVDAALLRTMPLPELGPDSDKDDRGQVFVIAGGPQVPGAPLLTGLAALRVGAGKLKIASTRPAAVALGIAAPEARIVVSYGGPDGEFCRASAPLFARQMERANAVVIGPGMMGDEAAALAIDLLEHCDAPLVMDAGVLSNLAAFVPQMAGAAGRTILTPHAGEMAALLKCDRWAVMDDPPTHARKAARQYQSIVILKGETSWIADPDGQLWMHPGGVSGLGTSGSGDVLAGVIGGLLARGASPSAAALRGVFLHAAAGRRLADKVGPIGFLAREILEQLPEVLALTS